MARSPRNEPTRPRPQPGERDQPSRQRGGHAKDDPHFAPESGDKPDAATPDESDLAERGSAT